MFTVEKMKQKDFPFAVELANTMNWNMAEADFAFNIQMEPDGCFVLKDNSRTVGLATSIAYGKVGWFGNLIIEETHRKHGAGTLLVKHAVNYLRGVGVTTIGLYAYKHLVNFYNGIGFRGNAEYSVMKAEAIASPATLEDPLKYGLPTQQEISQIIELDAACFGGSRAKLLHTILADKSNICYIAKEKGEVDGFALASVYDGMAELGPLICRRNGTEIARALMSATLRRLEGSEVYMCLPSNEAELIEEAGRFGFKEEFAVVRMFLGAPVQKDCIYFAESLERG